VGDAEFGVGLGNGRHFGKPFLTIPPVRQDVRRLTPTVASHHAGRDASLVDEADQIGA
jgi:hypothetical protein